MKVTELVSCCYDTIIIYKPVDTNDEGFEDLYKGMKENIPNDLLELDVRCFGAKKYRVTEIEVRESKV